MTFSDIPGDAAVFVDANTFVYALSRHAQLGASCRGLLERIDREDISGVTSGHVLSETAHRLMTLEACATLGWPFTRVAQRLKRHPAELQKLSAHQQALGRIRSSRVQVVAVGADLLLAAADLSRQYGLLSGDALVVAVMQARGVTHLASHDADFDRVPGISRYGPA
jgi:predicted nucleic acid-binding protein